jgi:cytochrome c oxidase subunit II
MSPHEHTNARPEVPGTRDNLVGIPPMQTMRSRLRRLRPALAILALVALAACAKDAPLDTLNPSGPIAEKEDALFRPVFWIAAAIFFIVEALFLIAIVKFRDRDDKPEPKQVHGNTKAELAWTLAPALILVGVAVPTVVTIFELTPKAEATDLNVRVTGKQWWWEYQYLDLEPQIITANELVIPTGREIYLELESTDVIHSFWVPKLAGKQDVVPGRTNHLELFADEPGEYYGQCAEFCSISHANMRLRVIALEPSDFDAWVTAQMTPAGPDTSEGAQLFANNCAVCHQVRTGDQGFTPGTGPNLTHLADRGTFGAGLYDLTETNLFDWLKNAREMKPGVIMPVFGCGEPEASESTCLSDEQISSIVDYLLTLK